MGFGDPNDESEPRPATVRLWVAICASAILATCKSELSPKETLVRVLSFCWLSNLYPLCHTEFLDTEAFPIRIAITSLLDCLPATAWKTMAPSNIPVLQECAPDGMMLNEEPGHTMAEYINGDHAADGVADHFTNGERVDGVQHGSKQMVDTEGHVVVDRTENAFVDGSLMGEDHVSNGFVSNSNGFVSKEQDNSNPMIESTSGKSASPLDIAICGMVSRGRRNSEQERRRGSSLLICLSGLPLARRESQP